MAVQASAQVVREMKGTIQKSMKEIQGIQQNIGGAVKATANWNDAQGEQYRALMQKIAKLTQTPVSTLNSSAKKLEKLAVSLDNYSKVKF